MPKIQSHIFLHLLLTTFTITSDSDFKPRSLALLCSHKRTHNEYCQSATQQTNSDFPLPACWYIRKSTPSLDQAPQSNNEDQDDRLLKPLAGWEKVHIWDAIRLGSGSGYLINLDRGREGESFWGLWAMKFWISCRQTKEVSISEQHPKHSISQPQLFPRTLFNLSFVYQ
jgi:hypothetical protein